MGIVLLAVLGFVLIGLSSKRFDWRHSMLVGCVAVMLATIQFAFERFL